MKIFNASQTTELLPWLALVEALEATMKDYAAGLIVSPERQVITPPGQSGSVVLSMPSASPDLFCHKLVTVCADNPSRGLPAIHGMVSCGDVQDGRLLMVLDGPTVTARRTAAVSMVGIRHLLSHAPRRCVLIGTGAQARTHVEALYAFWPDLDICVRARTPERAEEFCRTTESRLRIATDQDESQADLIVIATTATAPVYDLAARPNSLVVGLGAYRPDMAEIGPRTLSGSLIYVDDLIGAPAEAGDLLQAGVDWSQVRSIDQALGAPPPADQPIVYKTVGCAAWDLAACRTALAVSREIGG